MVVIADEAKLVETLGRFPLPIEVVPFGLGATRNAITRAFAACGVAGDLILRTGQGGTPYLTDGGHWIVDARLLRIPEPEALARALDEITGVVEHGLFIGMASAAVIAGRDGVTVIGALD
jgi:ribose 5-phosphate isomerase A